MDTKNRSAAFWLLVLFFAAYVLFLYGPMLVIVILSFQGPEGGLTFPLRGLSTHWFHKLAEGLGGRLQTLLKPTPGTHATKPEVVGQIMSRQVRVASAGGRSV